jgi:hypothetical protein
MLLLAFPLAARAASFCLDTAGHPPPARALAMAAAAQREHRAFGGQAMDAEGRLIESGLSEAEDISTGRFSPAPWQRVLGYWEAVDFTEGRLPALVRFGALRPADRQLLLLALNQASSDYLQGLGVGPDQGLQSHELRAARVAIDRVAVIDTPWSAAFVSWLARKAGLSPEQFEFSEAHVDYAGAAWQAGSAEASGHPTSYAMRACDITRTPPRVGDLICQARGAQLGLDSFDKIGEVLAARRKGGGALPMHCDVVVAVDATGFDAIGGNLLQSVTLRRMAFAPGSSVIDPSYLPDACGGAGAVCVDRHMSRQPWSLLLQWR